MNPNLFPFMQKLQSAYQQAEASGDQNLIQTYANMMDRVNRIVETGGGQQAPPTNAPMDIGEMMGPGPQAGPPGGYQPLGRVMNLSEEYQPPFPSDAMIQPQQAGPINVQQGPAPGTPPAVPQQVPATAPQQGFSDALMRGWTQQPHSNFREPGPSESPSAALQWMGGGHLNTPAPMPNPAIKDPITLTSWKGLFGDDKNSQWRSSWFNPGQPQREVGVTENEHELQKGVETGPWSFYKMTQDPQHYPGYAGGYSESEDSSRGSSAPSDQATTGQGGVGPTPYTPEQQQSAGNSAFGWKDFLGLLAGGRNYLSYKMRTDEHALDRADNKEYREAMLKQRAEGSAADRALKESDLAVEYQRNLDRENTANLDRDARSENNYVRSAMTPMSGVDAKNDPILNAARARILAQQQSRSGSTETKKAKY